MSRITNIERSNGALIITAEHEGHTDTRPWSDDVPEDYYTDPDTGGARTEAQAFEAWVRTCCREALLLIEAQVAEAAAARPAAPIAIPAEYA